MRLKATFAAAALAALATAGDADALTCYVVFDRGENVLYRDVYPPVDLSTDGRAEREAMRRRGEFLLFMESDQCPRLEFFTGAAGTVGLRLDETLAPSPAPAGSAAPALEVTREPAKPAAPRSTRKPAPKG